MQVDGAQGLRNELKKSEPSVEISNSPQVPESANLKMLGTGHLYTVAIVLVFMAVGPALMILNKEILDVVQFRYPILVSCLGLVASAFCTHILRALGMLQLQYESTIDFRFWLTKCLPVGICHAATLALGNAVTPFPLFTPPSCPSPRPRSFVPS